MSSKRILSLCLAGLILCGCSPWTCAGQGSAITADTFGDLRVRCIGPAVTGGRITALDAVPGNPPVIYAGAAAGGIWKSVDGGITYKPVFDEHPQSIGALAVDPSGGETVWAGTGESCVRNSVSVGRGIYKSTDAGQTWQCMGLTGSERIARIIVDPKNRNTVYVAAAGHLWDDSEERGVYRTTDGGETWKRMLYINPSTGCSDLAMDPQEPHIIYAGMWQFRRQPDFFTSGGPGSGLYKSLDGGETWRELKNGLPAGEKGRIAVAVAPSRPGRVYALVEAKKTALYRSDNAGESWEEVNASANIQARPFYFAHLAVDPADYQTVYKPSFLLGVSRDGGKSFITRGMSTSGSVHPDMHAIWINPRNPCQIILGTDGGIYVSEDRGIHWRFTGNIPVSQFYRVSYDLRFPYHVYGGLQDNSSWTGPSRRPGGIRNRDWENIGIGDGFWAFSDPQEPDFVYAEGQGGKLIRVRRSLGELKDIQPVAGAGEPKLRFNWNTPFLLSPNDPGLLYTGAQYLYRSRDRGDSWERISPDLTTNDPRKQRQKESGGLTIDNSTAENHTTIYTIAESPLDPALIWAGTDDGNLQLTRDGGKSWHNLASNVPGLPAGTWVSHVEASRQAAGTAYATFDGHRTGDMKPYVYRTGDSGSTWQAITSPEVEGYAHVIREDPVNPALLFLGTEAGLFISLDGGEHWSRFKNNLPPAPVMDLAVHPREGDLIIGTHGRGIYILDDLTPLRNLSAEVLGQDLVILAVRPSILDVTSSLMSFNAPDDFIGETLAETAPIVYWQKKRHLFGDFRIEIYDHTGQLLSILPGSRRAGLNVAGWNTRMKPPKVPPATTMVPAAVGPLVAEGTYRVKIVKGNLTAEGTLQLAADPRNPHPPAGRKLQQETALGLYRNLEDLAYLVETIISLRDQAKARAADLAKDPAGKNLLKLAADLEGLRSRLVSTSEFGDIAGDEKLREKLGQLYWAVVRYAGQPAAEQLKQAGELQQELAGAEQQYAVFTGNQLQELNKSLILKKLPPLQVPSREDWNRKEGGTGGSQGDWRGYFRRHPEAGGWLWQTLAMAAAR